MGFQHHMVKTFVTASHGQNICYNQTEIDASALEWVFGPEVQLWEPCKALSQKCSSRGFRSSHECVKSLNSSRR